MPQRMDWAEFGESASGGPNIIRDGHHQRFGSSIEVEPVPAFVLDLGKQDRLAFERWSSGDPVAFGQHPYDLRVRVLADLANQSLAEILGHPVFRLDELSGIDARVELQLKLVLIYRGFLSAAFRLLRDKVHCLGIHPRLLAMTIYGNLQLFRAPIDNATRLANQCSLDGSRRLHGDLARNANQRLDAVRQPASDIANLRR